MSNTDKMMLQFKMGEFAGLKNAEITPGTVYVTTDEQAMYVDVDSSTRIRLGEIIQYATYSKFKEAKPPYNEDAFYYLIDENALLKYRGVDEQGNHKWQQVNTVSDVQASVGKLETALGTLQGSITGLQTAVNETLPAAITKAKEDAISAAAADATTKANKAKEDAIADADGKIATLTTTVNGKVDKTAYDTTIGEIEADIEDITKEGGLIATAKQEAIDAAAADATSKANTAKTEAIADADGKLANKVDNSTFNTKIGTIEGNITDITKTGGLIDAAKASAAEDATSKANAAKEAAISSANGYTDGKVTELTTAINGKVSQSAYDTKVAELANAITKAQEDAEANAATDATSKANKALEDAKKYTDEQIDLVEAEVSNKVDTSAYNTKVGELTNAITKAQSDAEAKAAELAAAAKSGAETTAANALQGAVNTINGELAKKATTAQLTELTNTLNQAIADAEADAVETANAYTDEKVSQALAEADAMTFRGVISLSKALPTTGVQCGDVYKVAEKGTYAGIECYVGDLLIASADQGEEATYAGGWDHVSSGYEDDYDAFLTVDAANSKVIMTNSVEKALGSVEFVGVDGVTVEVTGEPGNGGVDSKVSIGFAWGTF